MKYAQIDPEVFESLPDEVKTQLKPYEPEDVSGLKNKANELLGDLKRAQAEIAERDAQIKSMKVKPSKTEESDIKSQLEDALEKLTVAQQNEQQLQQKIIQGRIQTESTNLAAKLTKDVAKSQLLAEKIAARLKYDGENLTVLTSDGKPTVSKPDELLSELRESYPFLVDGRQATGGGATGSEGGAGDVRKVTRADFESMSHSDRASFAKSGGRVID